MAALKWVGLSDLLVSSGSIFIKFGVNKIGTIALSELSSKAMTLITNPYLILGVMLYVLSSFTWMLAISKIDLSKAYPILSSTYAFIPIVSWMIFGDVITSQRWIGIAIVCVGIMFMARS